MGRLDSLIVGLWPHKTQAENVAAAHAQRGVNLLSMSISYDVFNLTRGQTQSILDDTQVQTCTPQSIQTRIHIVCSVAVYITDMPMGFHFAHRQTEIIQFCFNKQDVILERCMCVCVCVVCIFGAVVTLFVIFAHILMLRSVCECECVWLHGGYLPLCAMQMKIFT